MARNPWLRIATDTWLVALEASNVIALRMLRLAAGGAAAQSEATRMISEKFLVASTLNWLGLFGALGYTAPSITRKSLRNYRKVIRANRRRLERHP
jgi:hypothetical protein